MTNTDDIKQISTHTPEPWRVHRLNNGWPVVTSDAHDITDLRFNGNGLTHVEANARRICAAVNACKGISIEALEQGAIGELLEALKGCLFALDKNVDGYGPSKVQAIAAAAAAIATATGRAA